MLVKQNGHTIDLDMECLCTSKRDDRTTELKSSHNPMLSKAENILKVIRKAQRYSGKKEIIRNNKR